MDFVVFFAGIGAVAVALAIIKFTSPNPKHGTHAHTSHGHH